MRTIAIGRILALATSTPHHSPWAIEHDLDGRDVGPSVSAIAVGIDRTLLAATPRILAGVALINERSSDDASGRLWARVGHPLVVQPPGGLSNFEPRPNAALQASWCQSTDAPSSDAPPSESIAPLQMSRPHGNCRLQ
jgi:hypothetical protein